MKVDTAHVFECFNQVKLLLAGIADAIRVGDDGFEQAILSQSDDINKVMNVFAIEHMTPVTKPTKSEHYFLTQYERLQDKVDDGLGLSPQENILLFKSRVYVFLKRELPKHDLPVNVSKNELSEFIENVVGESSYGYMFQTDFWRDLYNTIDLVAGEIIEQRRKHPQLEINLNAVINNSKKIIDIL